MDGEVGGGGDHGAVVGAVFEFWNEDLIIFVKSVVEFIAEELVGGDAAGEKDGLGFWMELAGFLEFLNKDVNRGLLEAGGKIGDLLVGEMLFELVRRSGNREAEFVLDGSQDCGFDAAKGEIETINFWNRELVLIRIAV